MKSETVETASRRVRRTRAAREPVAGVPAIVVSRQDGEVIDLNASARALFGAGVGKRCWELVPTLLDHEGLPCTPGCVGQLLQGGHVACAKHTKIRSDGKHYQLTCIPAGQTAVCVLTPRADRNAELRQKPTPREAQVLRRLSEGMETAEIADVLGMRPATVRAHVEHLLTKFRVNSRAGLVALAFRLGYLE